MTVIIGICYNGNQNRILEKLINYDNHFPDNEGNGNFFIWMQYGNSFNYSYLAPLEYLTEAFVALTWLTTILGFNLSRDKFFQRIFSVSLVFSTLPQNAPTLCSYTT